MCDEAVPDARPDAEAVIAAAIAAMREDPIARTAADAIEGAWGDEGFDVERAVREIEPAEADEAE